MSPHGLYWFHQLPNLGWFKQGLINHLEKPKADERKEIRLLLPSWDGIDIDFESLRQSHLRHQWLFIHGNQMMPTLIQKAHEIMRYRHAVVKEARTADFDYDQKLRSEIVQERG